MNTVSSKYLAVVAAFLLASCGGGGSSSRNNPPAQTPANSAPVITSPASLSVVHAVTGTVYTAAATDADGDAISFAIDGGADADRFTITGSAISFAAPPDFDAPADADGDNSYEFQLAVADANTTSTLAVVVTVIDGPAGFSVRRLVAGLASPLFVTGRGDGSNRIFIVEKGGRIRMFDLGTQRLGASPFLDISATISTAGERGLLGLALAPDFASSGVFYVNVTNLGGDTEIRRYQTLGSDAERADPASGQIILTFPQLQPNHNGGWIGFDANGLLYIASGDGGGGGDPGGNGQNMNSLLGAILRIDPAGDDFPGDPNRQYAIPADNPFAVTGGAPEIWAYGLRNPFRAGFDRATGDLYIGDVGQGEVEEIDRIPAGQGGLNFGWNILEGTRSFSGGAAQGLTPPIAEYLHGTGEREGNSVIGGYVYRGPISALRGHYVFGDFDTSNIWSIDVASLVPGATIPSGQFTLQSANFMPDRGSIGGLSSFGEDDLGNLYVVDIGGEVFAVEPQ